jgi:hypothetical protein
MTVLVLTTPIDRADVPVLCSHARAIVRRMPADRLVVEVRCRGSIDLGTIDALLCLQLTVCRLGSRLCLRTTSGDLVSFIRFLGLEEELPSLATSAVEPLGEPEHREQSIGVEEEADAGDPAGRDLQDLD